MSRNNHIIAVYTGNGKGKTTSALGMLFRSLGHGHRCAVLQFIKHEPESWGEYIQAKALGVHWKNFGQGFTWQQKDESVGRDDAIAGWEYAKEILTSGEYDFVILDEISYVLSYGWVRPERVCEFLSEHRAQLPNLVLTGRHMPEEVCQLADMVSSIEQVKHHLKGKGIKAQEGIEY